jgi:hypothetical protein
METNVEEKLDKILNFVEQTATKAGDFVVEQTPLFVQELLAWNFTIDLIWFVIGVVSLLIIPLVLFLAVKATKTDPVNSENYFGVAAVISAVCLSVGIPLATTNLDWIKIKIAPRVWLVEYTKDFIKK